MGQLEESMTLFQTRVLFGVTSWCSSTHINIYSTIASLASTSSSRLLPTAINFSIKRSFNAINQIGTIFGGSIFDFDNGGWLLIAFLCKLCLCHLGGHARILYRLGTGVGNCFELELLLVTIATKVVICDSTGMVVLFSCGLGCWKGVSLANSAWNQHFTLLCFATASSGGTHLLNLRLCLLCWLLNFCPISVHVL